MIQYDPYFVIYYYCCDLRNFLTLLNHTLLYKSEKCIYSIKHLQELFEHDHGLLKTQ